MIDPRKYNNLYDLGKDIFLKDKYNPEIDSVIKSETIYEILEYRYSLMKDSNVPAIVSKPNNLGLPFKPEPHPDYPSPWLSVSYQQFFKLIKACAYVIKRRFDLPPQSRVGIIANNSPKNLLITYALWYNRCAVVGIPPKLGNDIKQFWARMLDIKMFLYDNSINVFDGDEVKQKEFNEKGQWFWEWQYPLKEDEYDLSAGYRGIPMFCIDNSSFCEEIYQCSLEGKTFARRGDKDDIALIIGTSSSTQAIIKNGQCSKMKFVPYRMRNCGTFHCLLFHKGIDLHSKVLVVLPFYHALGVLWLLCHIINAGGTLIFHTQKINDVGFVTENILDDIVDVKPDFVPIFPFGYAEIKKLFDENHPKCQEWAKAISSRPKNCFRSGGAPPNYEVMKWFEETFHVYLINEYGSSESGTMMHRNVNKPLIPGEINYQSSCPWLYFYLRPINDDPNEGELFIYNPIAVKGYITRAKKGEFYESTIPNMRDDMEHDELFEVIDNLEYYKTNDIFKRSQISGDYVHVARADAVITFGTGIKMNPIPFETAVTYECDNIKHCCLLLDDTQYEVVCFIEPEWSNIILENGKSFDISIDPKSLSNKEIINLRRIAQRQVFNSIFQLLMGSAKCLNSWAKQLTINNIVIIDYGKKFPVTAKGSLARRVARLEYSEVLKKISKLISGEIGTIDEIITESSKNKEEKEEVSIEKEKGKKIKENKSMEIKNKEQEEETSDININEGKTQDEINEEIQKAIMLIYESIKEIVPSTPEFEKFNIHAPFSIYSIESLGTRKLVNILNRKIKKSFSTSTLFNYGTTYDLAKYITNYDNNNDKNNLKFIPKSITSEDKKNSGKIAIIGMALRLPGAINNAKAFWMALAKGKDCVSSPVKDRNLHTGYVNKPSHLLNDDEHNIPRCGCYDTRSNVAKPSEFDAEFFNCLPEEATSLDPRHRWVLETSWEALENSGIAPNSLENTITGVFVGINDDHDYQDLMKANGIIPPLANHSSPNGIVGRLSYFYRLFGPSFTIDTACSTGASALHSACRSLQFGDCDLSIVSGVKYLYSSSDFHKTSVARMTSPSGRCATFDKDADGFVPGEGCVTFILKRYEDAIRDKDNILSVVLGSSSGQSGLRQSISAPSSDGQVINLKRALHFAGVKPSDISFVEAHGTGTPLGDAIEVNALNQVYKGTHTSENPLIIGSVKTNIGHTIEVSGLAGIAKVILAMQHKYIPKNLHFNTLNPEIDIESIPIQIPTKTIPWETKNNTPRIAQVSSFGLQGSIVHIILQEYIPEEENENEKIEKSKDSEEDHILTISAKSPSALLELSNNYLNILEGMEDNDENIENLCYTSNIGRQHFNYRMSAIGKNATELYKDLEEKIEEFEDNYTILSQQYSKNGNGISQNLEIFSESTRNIDVNSNIIDTIENLVHTENVFKQNFKKCESEIEEIFEDIASKESVDDTIYQLLILSFYYSLQKLKESLIIESSNSKTIYGGYGFGELVSIVIGGGLKITSSFTLVKIFSEGKINEKSILSWYGKQEIPKFKKNVYVSSIDKEFKNGDILSQNDIYYIMKNINEMKDTTSIIEKYGKKCNNLIVYSITGRSKDIKNTFKSKYSNLSINEFIKSYSKNSIFDQFIMNEYNQGKTINWEIYNSKMGFGSQKPCSYHKIDLPNYPFQRSTYWPVPLKH